MKIAYVHIKNFRLLKDLQIDFQDDLTLILGKNNIIKHLKITQ